MFDKQSGQVLPLGLVLVVLGLAGALILFNTSQLANDKMRLANSADAAAYSGALWKARALNYQAYANRAMLANQVAIGQAVTLKSWISYAVVMSGNIASVTRAVPVLNVVTSGIDGVAAAADAGVSVGAELMLRSSDFMTGVLSASQGAMQAAAVVNTAEIISVVARETDPRFSVMSAYGAISLGHTVAQWTAFNERYTKRDIDDMQERHQLIMDSRDRFTSARNWDLFDWWVPSSPLTWHKLRRQGTTKLVSVRTSQGMVWEWVAKDTISIHNKVETYFFGSDVYEAPVAWASAYANSRGRRQRIKRQACGFAATFGILPGSRRCSRFVANNHFAEELADTGVRSLSTRPSLDSMLGYSGVRTFWDLSDDARSAEDARLSLSVEVSMPAEQMRDSEAIVNADPLSLPVTVAGNTVSALSKADVFYRRPDHHALRASQREKANGYNPYWQAQLAPVSEAERGAALVLRSGGFAPKTHTGGTQ